MFRSFVLSNKKENWTNESDLLLIFFQVGLKIRCFMSMPLDFHPLNPLVLLGIKMFDLKKKMFDLNSIGIL